MTDQEASQELSNLYEQTAYLLEYVKRILSTQDSILRVLLADPDLNLLLKAKVGDEQRLQDTDRALQEVDLTLAAVRGKALLIRGNIRTG